MNTVEACEGMLAGKVKAFIGLGGNFVRAIPERERRWSAAWRDLRLTVQIATKLNRSHLVNGEVAYLLPCLGRTEEDVQASGPQAVTMEDTFSCIHGSIGRTQRPRASTSCRRPPSSPGSPRRRWRPTRKCKWDEWVGDYALIRDADRGDLPGRVPRLQRPDVDAGRLLPRQLRARADWKTKSGKAEFTTPERLSATGFDDAPGPLPPDHDAQQRPVQHDDLRLSATGCAGSRGRATCC